LIFVLALTLSAAAVGVEWQNLDDANHLGGRMTSEGYLRGKVVLVCSDSAQASRLETIWRSFHTKSFVLIGAFDRKTDGCSFPVYRGGGLARNAPDDPIYVVSATGRIVYKGTDDRTATESVVMALTDLESPKSVSQLKSLLDFELEALPGRAYLRLNDFRKQYPGDAQAYLPQARTLCAIPNVKKLAELVDFARKAKDTAPFGPKQQTQRLAFVKSVRDALRKYAPLKNASDQRVVQEAKNALADLKWTLAAHAK